MLLRHYAGGARDGVAVSLAGRWLLDVVVDGRPLRYTTHGTAAVASVSGEVLTYWPGLVIDSDPSGSDSYSVGVFDLAGVVAPRSLHGAVAVLRRWDGVSVIERARVVLAGRISAVSYSDPEAPGIEVTIARHVSDDGDVVPPAEWSISDLTCDAILARGLGYTYDAEVEGTAYPIVIGFPGDSPDGVPLPAVPRYMVDGSSADEVRYWAIGGGHRVGAVAVHWWDLDYPGGVAAAFPAGVYGELVAVSAALTADLRGVTLTTVLQSALNANAYGNPRTSWAQQWSGFGSGATYGGGVVDGAGLVISGLGSVLAWALRAHAPGARVSWSLLARWAPVLDRYRVDTWIGETVGTLEWCRGLALSFGLVEGVDADGGLYWWLPRWDATRSDAVAVLVDGQDARRLTAISMGGDPPVSRLLLDYAPRVTGGYRRRIVVSDVQVLPVPAPPQQLRSVIFPWAAAARAVWGDREKVVTCPHTWHDPTAARLASHLAMGLGVARRTMTVGLDLGEREIWPGDVVVWTDAEDSSIAGVAALVVDRRSGLADELEIVLLDAPLGGSS